jgi:UDP-glucose 4-epimerase
MEEPSPNEARPAPISPYAASKWASSIYARMFHALYELPVVVLHVFMVYGPGQRDLGKLVPYVTLSFLKGEDPMLSSGERRVDWIYIDDVVEGLIAAALAPGISGRTIDIGTGVLTPVREVVEELHRQTATRAKPIFGALADRPYENERSADAEGSWTGLGWKSRVSVQDGLRATVSWYRERLNEGEIS